MPTLGGGIGGDDARYVSGQSPGNVTNIVQFLTEYDSDAPFCLIASLVNPHDIFTYPTAIGISGYDPSAFASLPIDLPPTFDENLATKPGVQAAFQTALNDVWPFTGGTEPVMYSRFYAYLNTLADAQIAQILDALDAAGLTKNTLIVRIADHGELGLSHGGLRQKDYTAYNEMIRIPMIFSNPVLFPKQVETDALAGLIDVLPTLMRVAGIKEAQQLGLKGRDLSPLFGRPGGAVQERILFTYDDQLFNGLVQGASHIRCIREHDWKYALYFDPEGMYATEYEMYDLKKDPKESTNLAFGQTPPAYQHQRQRLQSELETIMQQTGTLPSQYVPPSG